MRICVITENYPPNGYGGGIAVYEMVKRLGKEFEITVVTPAYKNKEGQEQAGKSRIIRIGKNRIGFLIKAFLYLLKEKKFDAYHAHSVATGPLIRLASALKGGKKILQIHGFRDKKTIGALRYAIQALIIRLGYDYIISVDEGSNAGIASLGIEGKKLRVIPAGVDTQAFYRMPRKSGNGKVALFVGRLEQIKDVKTLLKSMKILKEKGVNVKLRIIGDGSLRKELVSFANSNGLDNVEFLEQVPHENMNQAYNNADFLVLPSLSEGCPLVLLEAMACELPFIVSDAPSLSRIAAESGAGFLFPRGNEDKLAELMERCSRMDRKELDALGKGGRIFVEKNNSWERISNEMAKLYR